MTEATMPVTVEQCDRDFAARFTTRSHGKIGSYTFSAEYMIRNGHWDDDPLVKAAARHRLNTRATPPSPAGLACTVPPEGWWCSRQAGHDGPCAAMPDTGDKLVDLIRSWMMSDDYPVSKWERDFAAAIRTLTANGSQPDRVVDALRERIANDIVRDVCELPGDDDIEADDTLIVSVDDLRGIVERNLSTLDAKDQT